MEIVMLFASLPRERGRALSPRLKQYCQKAAQFLKSTKGGRILFTVAALGFDPPEFYSQRVRQELLDLGVEDKRIIVLSALAHSTLNEIESAEVYIKIILEQVEVYAVGSWQHIPRILFLWKFKCKRTVHPLWVWDFSFETLFLLLLEPCKFLLSMLSSKTQSRLNDLLFKAKYYR